MSVGVSVKAKRWGKWALIGAAVLWVLWILSGSPWTPYGLWQDARQHEELLRQAATEMLAGRSLQPSESEKALANLGYKHIEVDNGVVLFYKYERFRGKGILGLAYAPGDIPQAVRDWANFYEVPPHWSWLHMPKQVYIFAGR